MYPFYLPCICLTPLLPALYLTHTPFICLILASHPFYLSCTCLAPLLPASYLPRTPFTCLVPVSHPFTCLVPASHPFYLPCTCLAPLLPTSFPLCTLCTCLTSFVFLISLTPLTLLAPLTPLTPFILICTLKDDWMHPVTPFQNQNFHNQIHANRSTYHKSAKGSPFLVPKSSAPPNSMNKLTLMSQQKTRPLQLYVISLFYYLMIPLLDIVGCAVIGNFQMDQRHLMLKVSLKSST